MDLQDVITQLCLEPVRQEDQGFSNFAITNAAPKAEIDPSHDANSLKYPEFFQSPLISCSEIAKRTHLPQWNTVQTFSTIKPK